LLTLIIMRQESIRKEPGKYVYRVSQVLPPDRKNPLLIDVKFPKKISIAVETFCKNFKFFNETGKYFVLIQ
jgi:hypothetical protein